MKLYISNKTSGFSLIELMIVVAIIGILASIAIPSYQSYIAKSKMAHLFAFADDVRLKLTEYHASVGSFPTTAAAVSGLVFVPANSYIANGGNAAAVNYNAIAAGNGLVVGAGSSTSVRFTIIGSNINPGNDPVLQYTATFTPATSSSPARMDWGCGGALVNATYTGVVAGSTLPPGYLPSTCTLNVTNIP